MDRPDKALRNATGKGRGEWYAKLDAWGATNRQYREIAEWLTSSHGLSRWWAQKLIVEYEEDRGVRDPGVQRDGSFSVGASKTVDVPVDRLFDAFVDARQRGRWLPGSGLRKRSAVARRSARFDRGDASRVDVAFVAKDKEKSQVTVQHERLPNAKAAQEAKAYWRERLTTLKTLLEKPSPPS